MSSDRTLAWSWLNAETERPTTYGELANLHDPKPRDMGVWNAVGSRCALKLIDVGSAGRVGVAHAQVHDGAFELLLPGTMNFDLYNEVGLYIDNNGNDACNDDEAQWGYVSGRVMDHLLLEVTPHTLCVINGGPQVGAGCRAWNPQPEPCYVDGPVDIRMALPCSQ